MFVPELEERQAKIEGVLEQIDKRVGRLESELIRVENKIDFLDSKVDSVRSELHGKLDSNFRWLVGIMITMWITIIMTIIFKG